MAEVRRNRRETSGSFTQLTPDQVRRLKEAYSLLDKNGDGIVSNTDLEQMLTSLGRAPSKSYIDDMMADMPQPITFSVFLTRMSDMLGKTAPSEDLLNAFKSFEQEGDNRGKENTSRIHVDELKEMLIESGMDERDINESLKPFLKQGGLAGDWFYYRDFVNMLKGGELID